MTTSVRAEATTGEATPAKRRNVTAEPRYAVPPPGDVAPGPAVEAVRMTAWVRGRVQRVGFRWFTRETAMGIGGLRGFASNMRDGRVHVVAEGAPGRCAELLDWLRAGDTPGRVDGVTEIWGTPRGGYEGFEIR